MVGCLRRESDDLGLHVDGGAAVMSQHIPASIVRAVRDGDLATLEAGLESGGSEFVDEMIEDRDYLIERAIEADSANAAATVDLLLRAGAQPRRRFVEEALDSSNGKRANAEAALNLLKSGADMRGGEDENWTALHSACRLMETGLARQDEVVRALLEAGAPVDAQDGYHGKTPLMYAAWSGFTNPLVLSCVEIKILRRVRAESSRRPPRHRRDAFVLNSRHRRGAFVLNRRVVLHAIDATPARWRGDAGSSPLDRARTAASLPRNDFVKNYLGATRHTG